MIASSHAAKAYSRIGLETGVAAASPHRLVVMLYEGALLAVMEAESHLAAQRAAQKARAISRAIMIINDGLKASLDPGQGGSIALQLHELYDYMGRRLLAANLHNDADALAEVARLLRELKSAWEAIDGQAGAAGARTARGTITLTGQPGA
ncbi:MAG: flagellar export chaperone FliS [Burkholderiales bacterium]